jgi:hypothetical protein
MEVLAETIAVLVEPAGDYAYDLMLSRACEQKVLDVVDEPFWHLGCLT